MLSLHSEMLSWVRQTRVEWHVIVHNPSPPSVQRSSLGCLPVSHSYWAVTERTGTTTLGETATDILDQRTNAESSVLGRLSRQRTAEWIKKGEGKQLGHY